MTKVYCLLFVVVLLGASGCGSSGDDDNPSASGTSSQTIGSNAVAPQITNSADHGDGAGWKKDTCVLCHRRSELREVHDFSPALSASFFKLGEADIGICLYCHGSNGLSGVGAEMYRCLNCHADSTTMDSAEMFAGVNVHDMNGDGQIGNADCVVCHAFSDMNGEMDVAVDLRQGPSDYENVTAFCLNCHDGNGAFGIVPPVLSTGMGGRNNIYSTYKGMGENPSAQYRTADYHGSRNSVRYGPSPSGSDIDEGECEDADSTTDEEPPLTELRGTYTSGMEVACLDCHQVHSSDNPYMITESGATAGFADDAARAASVMVTENDFSQLCAVCHTSPEGAPTDNGLTQVVHSNAYSTYCTDCHYHGAGHSANQSGLF